MLNSSLRQVARRQLATLIISATNHYSYKWLQLQLAQATSGYSYN